MEDYNIFEDCDNAKNKTDCNGEAEKETICNGETDFVAELLKIEAAVDDIIESTHACLENLYNMVADFGNKSVALQVENEELQKRLEAALKERDKARESAAELEEKIKKRDETIRIRTERLAKANGEIRLLNADKAKLKGELEALKSKKKGFKRVISFLREN